MRIGISGVSNTGKSTLAKCIAQELELPVLLDSELHARTFEFMETKGLAPKTQYFPNMTSEERLNFQRCIYTKRVEQEQQAGDDWVADETPIDFLNYWYLIAAPNSCLVEPGEFPRMVELWKKRLELYDYIWYLPSGLLSIKDDHRRFTDPNLLKLWDFSLRGIIDYFKEEIQGKLKYMPPCTDLSQRVSVVLKQLRVQ